jgi:hypothetical protein
MYSSTLSLTSALDVGGQRHAPAALPPGMTRYPLYRRLGGPQGRSGPVRKISPPPRFDPRTVQSIASHYTDWDTPAQSPPYSVVKQIFVVSHQIRPMWQYPLNTKGIKNHEAGVTSTGKTLTVMSANLSTKDAVGGHTQHGALVSLQDKQTG